MKLYMICTVAMFIKNILGESILTNFEQKKFSQKLLFLKYPIPKIPEDFENKSGMDRVLKKISGSVGYRVPVGP